MNFVLIFCGVTGSIPLRILAPPAFTLISVLPNELLVTEVIAPSDAF